MLTDTLYIAIGLVLLFLGGEFLVRGSVAIATNLGISKVVVGLVIVGFGTSAPELLVSLQAALAGSPDIAIGNVVGSNIANILLIVGVAALIVPVSNPDTSIHRDVLIMVGVSLLLMVVFQFGEIGRLTGLAFVMLLGAYLFATYRIESLRRESVLEHEADEFVVRPAGMPIAIIGAVAGLIFLVLGARLLVDGATGIATAFGVSEAVIGLTIVAVGTSLPELATAIVASLRRHGDVVLANVVGSNIFNILCILGFTAIIAPIHVAERFAASDVFFMLGVAGIAAAILLKRFLIGRGIGMLFLIAYGGYIAFQGL